MEEDTPERQTKNKEQNALVIKNVSSARIVMMTSADSSLVRTKRISNRETTRIFTRAETTTNEA